MNVALPSIGRELHSSVSGLQWTIDAYTLVLGSLLILGGATADRIGRKHVFQTGLITFVLGSAGCAATPSSSGCSRVSDGDSSSVNRSRGLSRSQMPPPLSAAL